MFHKENFFRLPFGYFHPCQVCSQWEEIALIIRDGQFSADEEHLIDVLDVKLCTCM